MRGKVNRSRTLFISVCLLLLAFCIAPAAAIGVSGAKYMGSIQPGGTSSHVMIVNIGPDEKPVDIAVEVEGFGQTHEAVYIPLDPSGDTSPFSARRLIQLDRSTLHLEPGSDQKVTATITLPQDAGPGGRYAIISVRALPGQGQAFTTRVNVPVFITVSGKAPTEAGSILEVTAGEVIVGQPIVITTTLKNTGNYHYYNAWNWILVKDAGGAVLANSTSAPVDWAIIPGNTVRFTVKPEIGSLQPGTYTVVSRVLLEDGRVLDEKTTTFEVKQPYIPPVTESSILLTPGGEGVLTSPDGRVSVTFPQGSVLSDVLVTLKPYAREKLHQAPAGSQMGATFFEVAGLSGLLNKDAMVRVAYSADDLAAAGGDASRLRLAIWDPVRNEWMVLATQVNTRDMTLTAGTNRMGVWAVLVSSSGGLSPAPTKTPLPVLPVILALVIAVGSLSYVARRRR
jgi:hypothetical protein